MPTPGVELVLFASSFSPLFVVFGLLESFGAGWPSIVCYVVAAASVVGLSLLLKAARRLAVTPVTVVRARQRDSDAIAYVATYVVPFATLGVADWRSRAALLLFLALIAILYIRAHLFYVNPLLSIVGYRLFEVETGSDQLLLVVTRRPFLASGAELDVRTLSDYVYLEG
jgi:hypothetical protein